MGLESILLQPSQKFTVANAAATLPLPATVADGQPIPKTGGGPQSLRRLLLKIKASTAVTTLTAASVYTWIDGEWSKLQAIAATFAAGDLVTTVVVDMCAGDRIAIAGTVGGAGAITVTAYPIEVTL